MELLVVIGILLVLLAVLLPALSSVRESVNRLQCANNLRSVGQFVIFFAQDHHGRIPEAQNTPFSGAGAQVPTWMYTKDYFALVDDYGANQRLFICPSGPLADVGPSGFAYGEGSELAARADLDELPVDPRPRQAGDEDLTQYWVQIDYVWMGRNIQEEGQPAASDPYGAPFEVTRLSRDTFTGTDADANPPLMADVACYQPGVGTAFTHGKHWEIPSFDPTPSLHPWSQGMASAHLGDVRINVLYRDGHVSLKPPDRHAYDSAWGAYYFR